MNNSPLQHLISFENPKRRFPKSRRLRKSSFWLILAVLIGLAIMPASAQQPEAASSTARVIVPLDTTPFLFTFSLSPERFYPASDTLADFDFRMYDPARRRAIDYGTLGNVGAAARPLFFETTARRGFDPGFHAFDLYALRPADLQFFRNTRSFTDLFFSQGRIQNDNMLRARFSRTFADGLNFSLIYATFNHLGQYRYQAAKHIAFAVGVWYPVSPRYELFFTYSRNSAKQQENGGIVTDTLFGGGQFSGPIDAPVRLSDEQALTKQADWSAHFTHHLKFAGAGDSSAGKRVLRASHTAEWTKKTFKFSDPGSDPDVGMRNDSLFFDNFLVDRRGIRHVWALNRLDNTITLNTFKSKNAGRPSDELALGITHSLFTLKQEPAKDSVFSNLFLTGKLALTPSERFSFIARGDLGVITNFGEYSVSGELKIGLGKAGEFRASLLSQRYPPSMLSQRLYVSKRLFWQNDFAKPLETSLSATYALPLIGLEVTGKTHLVNNYLYFNQQGVATQTASPLQVAQLLLRENLRFKGLHLDNTVALQRANRDDVLRLPQWFTKNSLYFSGYIIKKRLLLNIGADFRLNGEFMPDGYQPVTAQFYLQDSLTAKPYPWLDVFVTVKIKTFRFFFRYENLSTLWDDRTVFYQTAHHPQPFGAIRMGVGWRFMDSNQEQPKPSTGPPGSGSGGPPPGIGRGF
jgi:hypothetical protein